MDTFLGLDAVTLARIQFAFTVVWHFLFPAFTIGLASYLAVLNGLWLRTRDGVYLELFGYWVKIFAISFAMGVVSGIVMSYQFGTNWSVFSDIAGPVVGPLMAYEVLTAFFLEAGFLGIMLFGRDRVGEGLHMAACVMVAFGTALSATWILSVNSWMHTPAGFTTGEAGTFVPTDWLEVIFNPSMPYRLAHTLTAAYLTTALIVGGVGAFHLLRGRRDNAGVRRMFGMAMGMVAVVAPLQLLLGHAHGVNTLEHQPQKVMAMEGHYESYPDGAPLYLFGLPNEEAQRLDAAIGIPFLGSVVLKGDPTAPVDGLDTIPDDEQPPVAIVFWSFRIMVGLGLLMIGLGGWAMWARHRGRLHEDRGLHRFALAMGPSGLVAVTAGWVTTEVGRQPYTVYGLLRTADSASPIGASEVGTSLMLFVVVYFAVFGVGILYLLRLMAKPPAPQEPGAETEPAIRTAGITPALQPGGGQREARGGSQGGAGGGGPGGGEGRGAGRRDGIGGGASAGARAGASEGASAGAGAGTRDGSGAGATDEARAGASDEVRDEARIGESAGMRDGSGAGASAGAGVGKTDGRRDGQRGGQRDGRRDGQRDGRRGGPHPQPGSRPGPQPGE